MSRINFVNSGKRVNSLIYIRRFGCDNYVCKLRKIWKNCYDKLSNIFVPRVAWGSKRIKKLSKKNKKIFLKIKLFCVRTLFYLGLEILKNRRNI